MKEKKKSNKKSQSGKRTQWHPAFCAAAHLEFRENKDDLEFLSEYDLNTKPITIDLLIIRKTPGAVIQNEIGSFFRNHNIFEYKSPRDALNIDTLYKGFAYACLYKTHGTHVNEIRTADITLTFIRQNRPKELFRILGSEGADLEQESPGIYLIKGLMAIDTRIIVTDELDPTRHVWLNSLTDNMSSSDAERLIISMQGLSAKDDVEFGDSVFKVAITKNTKAFNQLKGGYNDMSEALREFFKPELDAEIARIEAKMKAEMEAAVEARIKAENDAILQQQKAEIIELKKRIAELSAAQSVPADQKD